MSSTSCVWTSVGAFETCRTSSWANSPSTTRARVVANTDDRLLLELTLRQHINEAGTLKALTESLDGAAGVYLVAALFEDAAFNSPLGEGSGTLRAGLTVRDLAAA